MGNRFNSQSLILVGCTLFVLYLAGVPLLMLLYGSIRSAPIGEPGAHFTIANYVKAYVDKEFYLLLLNSVYYAIGTCTLDVLDRYLSRLGERAHQHAVQKTLHGHVVDPLYHPRDLEHDFVDPVIEPEDRPDQHRRQGGVGARGGAVQRLFDVGHDLGRVDSSLPVGFSLDVGGVPQHGHLAGRGGADRRVEHLSNLSHGDACRSCGRRW